MMGILTQPFVSSAVETRQHQHLSTTLEANGEAVR